MVVTSKDNILWAEEFPLKNSTSTPQGIKAENSPGPLKIRDVQEEKEKKERLVILKALQNSENITVAAKSLGISRATLVRRMRRYGIKRGGPVYEL